MIFFKEMLKIVHFNETAKYNWDPPVLFLQLEYKLYLSMLIQNPYNYIL
jgi:hypothetical protein